MQANWRLLVRINYLHCPRLFAQSLAPLSVSPSDGLSSIMLSTQEYQHRNQDEHNKSDGDERRNVCEREMDVK